jgi:FkbM family methyltransferase
MDTMRLLLRRSAFLRRMWRKFRPLPFGEDEFLQECRSIIHIGANAGGERFLYESLGLRVVWIEAIPLIFKALENNIRGFRGQAAINALLADEPGRTISFKISNNGGASSSIFEFGDHSKLWPEVTAVDSIVLTTKTLDEVISPEQSGDAIILDVQGAELLVLQGGSRTLEKARFLKIEAADFPAYVGGCTLADITDYLAERGYREQKKTQFATEQGVGSYYDVIFVRDSSSRENIG